MGVMSTSTRPQEPVRTLVITVSDRSAGGRREDRSSTNTQRSVLPVSVASQPILIYVGTADTPHAGALRARELNPGVRVIELDGDDHSAAATRSDVVVPAMLAMIEGIPAE